MTNILVGSTTKKFISINYTEETSSKNLNNNMLLQIIIEQNISIMKLLKYLIEYFKRQQTELINEIRHTNISLQERKLKDRKLLGSYPYSFKSVIDKNLFEFESEKQK